jgi:hypothetical protein
VLAAFIFLQGAAPAARPGAPAAGRAGEGEPAPVAMQAEVRTLGAGSQAVYVVRRGRNISLFVDQVPIDLVLEQLQEVGGPTFSNRPHIVRPVTVVVHDVTMEEALRRLLKHINVSFHYRDGRIAHVSMLGEVPGRTYTPPRPVESQSEWSQIETGR